MDPALLLLQAGEANATGVFRFFVGFFLVMILYGGAWAFTYWISKDE